MARENSSDPFVLDRPSEPGGPAWEVALLFPNQGQWSEAEYLALDTNRLVELSNGRLEVLSMPTILHQLVVGMLHRLLADYVASRGAGMVLFAPLPVRLRAGTLREPDVVYLRPERVRDLRRPPDGADLVMEVVSDSPEDRRRDLVVKRHEYAQAGIPEYWIVDLQERQITVLTLDGQTYREHGVFAPGSDASSVLLGGFAVSVEAVFSVQN